jgi:hypothetical protein
MPTYKLNVAGRFAAAIEPDTTHCGLNPKPFLSFSYAVDIEADALDSQDFVMDNLDVVAHFDGIRSVGASCEVLAELACGDLWRPHFTSIAVRIHGTDFASVTCTKVRGQNGCCS